MPRTLVQLKNKLKPDLAEELLEQIVQQFWGDRVVATVRYRSDWSRTWDIKMPGSKRQGVEATNRQLCDDEDYGFPVAFNEGLQFDFSEPRNSWENWAMRKVRQEVAKTLNAILTVVSPEEYVIDLKDTFREFVISAGKSTDWTEHMLWTAPEAFKD